jgi:hypothetical protein
VIRAPRQVRGSLAPTRGCTAGTVGRAVTVTDLPQFQHLGSGSGSLPSTSQERQNQCVTTRKDMADSLRAAGGSPQLANVDERRLWCGHGRHRRGGIAVTDDTPDQLPVHPKHRAYDRFGKEALHAAHGITRALAEAGVDDDGVVVLRTDGKRHSFVELEVLIDSALAEDAAAEEDPAGAPEPRSR